MLFSIVSDIPGRLRLRCGRRLFSEEEARGVSYALLEVEGVRAAEVHAANGSILVLFEPEARGRVLAAARSLDVLHLPAAAEPGLAPAQTDLEIRLENNRFSCEVVKLIAARAARWALLPAPLQVAYACWQAAQVVAKGVRQLLRRQITVEVLDATAVGEAILRRSFSEAGTICFLLELSSIMEEHVQSRARLALRDGLQVRSETVWAWVDGADVQVRTEDVQVGMVLHLGAGSVLPVDGCVAEGTGEVDESSMTGEAAPVPKEPGSTVYAGTALKDGDLKVRVTALPGASRIDAIVDMVEENAELKANVQGRAEHLADAIVPYSFLAFFAILAITRNPTKAMAVLMVDYSCAIKLSTPIAVMSAMDEAAQMGVVVRGGKYLEALAAADTVVFDKTGTLTHASPAVERVFALDGSSDDEILRLSACIEEHFPHSMARAIVAAAQERGLVHETELHAQVRYVVAHGIATTVDGHETSIGSAHFLFEDEGVVRPEGLLDQIERECPTASVIYIAREKTLIGAICISDPPREEAAEVLQRLREKGLDNLVMLTGDAEGCARHVAGQLGLDAYHAQVLPEDKSSYVDALRADGHTVVMVGDGINDSPALAAANVSVAMSDASDIARAVADVLVQDASLESLVTMRELSQRLMGRIETDYRFIVGFNSLLIALGVGGFISLTTAAYLHNVSTLAIAGLNTRPLLGVPHLDR